MISLLITPFGSSHEVEAEKDYPSPFKVKHAFKVYWA